MTPRLALSRGGSGGGHRHLLDSLERYVLDEIRRVVRMGRRILAKPDHRAGPLARRARRTNPRATTALQPERNPMTDTETTETDEPTAEQIVEAANLLKSLPEADRRTIAGQLAPPEPGTEGRPLTRAEPAR